MVARQRTRRRLQRLLAQHYPGQKLAAVINTHWHWANSGFNATARRSGADVIAHENTKLWLGTEVNSRWEGRVYPAQPANVLPNRTFFYGPQALISAARRWNTCTWAGAYRWGHLRAVSGRERDRCWRCGVAGALSHRRFGQQWLAGWHQDSRQDRHCAQRCKHKNSSGCRASGQRRCAEAAGRDVLHGDQPHRRQLLQRPDLGRTGRIESNREFDAQYGDAKLFLKQSYDTAWYHVGEIRRVAR